MLYFISSNYNKFKEVKRILDAYNIEIEFREADLLEIQADNLEEVAEHKIREASRISNDILIEDDGLFIDVLNGFPGVYSSYVYKTIGNDGILKLMKDIDNRYARFVSIIAYSNTTKLFKGIVEGHIAYSKRGSLWGYDPIFIPKGYSQTYAELKDEKDKISHRNQALIAFAKWYNKNKKNKDLMLE